MTIHTDAYYSPPWVAERLADELPPGGGGSVFDPAMGEGSLLSAAEQRLGASATIIGADIDQRVVESVRSYRATWCVGIADATNQSSRVASAPWRFARQHGVDYVLMNPPFSYRGAGQVEITIGGQTARVAPAVAFVAIGLLEIQPRIGLYAVLPRGSIDSYRDRWVWSALEITHSVSVREVLPRGTFRSVTATSVIVAITPRAARPALSLTNEIRMRVGSGCTCIEIVRGRIPTRVQKAAQTGLTPWLHTTELSGGEARPLWTDLPRDFASSGPLLVLPRVGRFDPGKVAITPRSHVALSECVIGLRRPQGSLQETRAVLVANEDELRRSYFGTGAPHITLGRLQSLLTNLGLSPRHVSARADPQPCSCTGAPVGGAVSAMVETSIAE